MDPKTFDQRSASRRPRLIPAQPNSDDKDVIKLVPFPLEFPLANCHKQEPHNKSRWPFLRVTRPKTTLWSVAGFRIC